MLKKINISKTKINIGYSMIYRIITMLIPLITSPYLSRVLGAEKIGEYSFVSAIAYYFFSFAMLGVNDYGNREVAKVRDNKDVLSNTFWQIFYLQFFLSVLLSIIYFVIVIFTFDTQKLIGIIFTFYVLSAITDINWFCYGIEKFKHVTVIWVIYRVLSALLIFVFVKDSFDLWIYTLIINGGQFFFAFLNWPIVFKTTTFRKPNFKAMKEHVKPNFILFLPAVALSLFHYMDRLMMGLYSQIIQIGYYNYAENIITIPMGISDAIESVMLPKISNLVEKNKKQEEKELLYKTIKYVSALNIALFFGLSCVSKIFVPWYLGKDYIITAELVILLSPVIFISGFSGLIRYQYLIPRRMDKPYLISILCGAILNFILNLFLIPKFTAVGAAIATVLSHLMVAFVQFIYTKKEINYKKIVLSLIPCVFNAIIMMIVVLLIPFVHSTILTLFLKIFAGIIVYSTIFVVCERIFINHNFRNCNA